MVVRRDVAAEKRPSPGGVREEILRAATRMFAERGYDGTSIQSIAEAVGIRKPSLLYHFSSKEDLRQAVLDEVFGGWNEILPALLVAATVGEGQFDAITKEIVAYFRGNPDSARLLIREALDRPADMHARLASYVRPIVANLAAYIRKGQPGTVHGDVDPEAYLFQMVNLLITGVAFSESFHDLMPSKSRLGEPFERLINELLRMGKASLLVSSPSPHPQNPTEGVK